MISDWLPLYQNRIDDVIQKFFDVRYSSKNTVEIQFEEAMRYAVQWGGKRLRTVLACLSYEYYSSKSCDAVLPFLIGIEMIHAYTLVHDDLPCMDNDEYRRGKLTVWKKYGETMAVLVGDALQTFWFETIASSGNIAVVQEFTKTMGDIGVVRGQVRDTMLRQDMLSLEELLRIHDEKTGGFIAASLVAWGLLADANGGEIQTLREFGLLLGRAFQIRDDILDYEGNRATLGKEAGKDVALGKGIVALIGIEWSRALLDDIEQDMLRIVRHYTDERFRDIVEFVVHREK